MAWHRFTPYSDDDQICPRPRCGLIVADDALDAVQLPCPAPPCPDETNSDGVCLIVPTELGAECAYCGQSATLEDLETDPWDPDPLL